jgi:hypothetical protein
MRTLEDLRGALRDEADGTAYPDVEAMVAGAGRRVAATRRRRLAVLGAVTAAVLVVGGVAVSRPEDRALPQPAGTGTSSPTTPPTSPATDPTTSATASRTASGPVSQSEADAVEFGIDPAVAAVPIAVRVFQPDSADWPVATTQASTPEGLWLVSRADQSSADISAYPELTQYGELLLLSPDRSRILRAYPFKGAPPQWLLVTPKAVYCGRQGDGGLPDSMVCRVDRATGALRVVIFPNPLDSAFGDPQTGVVGSGSLAGRPGTWWLAGPPPLADLQHVPSLTANGLLFARDPNQDGGGKALRLDPVSLK